MQRIEGDSVLVNGSSQPEMPWTSMPASLLERARDDELCLPHYGGNCARFTGCELGHQC